MKLPNVVVFLTDQQRWDCSGLQGNPLDLMPNFDRLAGAGAHLRNSFSCQPLCVPARACLQTGLYSTSSGVYSSRCSLPPEARTLAHDFAAAGYRTAYMGKWHLAPRDFPAAVPPEFRGGYQDWLAANALELVSDAYCCRLWDEVGTERKLPGYRADALTDAAIQYVRRPRGGQPFFLFLSYLEPHQQNQRDDFPAPAGYADRYRGRWMPQDLAELGGNAAEQIPGYYGMVKRLDECLGRLCAALKEQGIWNDTILLFTSDHGCHFKTRNDEYKRSCHESSIRVPTFFHGPGFSGAGDRPELVSLIDLPPTLLEAAGLPVPVQMQGQSLMPRLAGGAGWRDEIFVQISGAENARALRTRRWKYSVTVPEPAARQARHERTWPIYADSALYDLERDPAELVNLASDGACAGVIAKLRVRLLERMAEAGEPIPRLVGG